MLNKLLRLANQLDKAGFTLIADEVDSLAKTAADLSPEKEKELDESVDRYFGDADRQERNLMEQEYGLDQDDMFGLERAPWHGNKWSYEGFPRDKAEHFKKFERYQTVIGEDGEAPESIEDPLEGGVWEREQVFDKPEHASKGKYQAVYRFVPLKEQAERMQPKEDNPFIRMIMEQPDEVEVPEAPEDVIETKEVPKQHGGGVKLF